MFIIFRCLLLAWFGLLLVQVSDLSAEPHFSDITDSALGSTPISCKALTLVDYDTDGLVDIMVDGRTMLKNQSGVSFTAIDLGIQDAPHAAVFADCNGDGDQDLLVVGGFAADNRLLINVGQGQFVASDRLSAAAAQKSLAAAWGDFNSDGCPDLVLGGGAENPSLYESGNCGPDRLLLNQKRGNFCSCEFDPPVILQGPASGSCAKSVSAAHYNYGDSSVTARLDYKLDILIGRDAGQANALLLNQGGGDFLDLAEVEGFAGEAEGFPFGRSQGLAWFWQEPDLECHVVANTRPSFFSGFDYSEILCAPPDGSFSTHWQAAQLPSQSGTHAWTTPVVGDFDNDGDSDFYLGNRGPFSAADSNPQTLRGTLFERDDAQLTFQAKGTPTGDQPGDEQFAPTWTNFPAPAGTDTLAIQQGDIDNDGRLDLIACANSSYSATPQVPQLLIFKNITSNPGHWLLIDPLTVNAPYSAHDMRIVVSDGANTWQRMLGGTNTQGSHGPHRAHFGLGASSATVTVSLIPTQAGLPVAVHTNVPVDGIFHALYPQLRLNRGQWADILAFEQVVQQTPFIHPQVDILNTGSDDYFNFDENVAFSLGKVNGRLVFYFGPGAPHAPQAGLQEKFGLYKGTQPTNLDQLLLPLENFAVGETAHDATPLRSGELFYYNISGVQGTIQGAKTDPINNPQAINFRRID